MIKTKLLSIEDLDKIEIQDQLKQAINQNKLVIFPTETVYGIGGNALNECSAKAIYEAKGRPQDNPLIVHIHDEKEVAKYALSISEKAKRLMTHFWPGPLTLIFQKKDIVPKQTTGGLETVAIRLPSNPVAQKLLNIVGTPLAAPSANLSGKPSSTMFKHVKDDFYGKVDFIIDGGKSTIGLESTVLDVTKDVFVLLRPGSITKKAIEDVLNEPIIDQSGERNTEKVMSPGMKYTHYKPKGNVILLSGTIEHIKNYLESSQTIDSKTALICATNYQAMFSFMNVFPLGNLENMDLIASNLFSSLREMDEKEMEQIYIIELPKEDIGYAIMNRVLKAAGYQTLKL